MEASRSESAASWAPPKKALGEADHLKQMVDADGERGLTLHAGRVERAHHRMLVRGVVEFAVERGALGQQVAKREHRESAPAGLVVRYRGLVVAAAENQSRRDGPREAAEPIVRYLVGRGWILQVLGHETAR